MEIDSRFLILEGISTFSVVREYFTACISSKIFGNIKGNFFIISFKIKVKLHLDKKSPAENRNIAADNLNTDIISFFDADDIMHPQRIELLEYAFLEPCDIVLHNSTSDTNFDMNLSIDKINIHRNKLKQCKSGCIILDYISPIAHGHVTVRKSIFNKVRFPEEEYFYFKEDCIFCHRVFDIPDIKSAYFSYPLSLYIPSKSWNIEHSI